MGTKTIARIRNNCSGFGIIVSDPEYLYRNRIHVRDEEFFSKYHENYVDIELN
jgi:hypothetical protein